MYSKGYTDVALFTEPISSISPRAERAAVYQEMASVQNVNGLVRLHEIDVKDKEQLKAELRSFHKEMPEQKSDSGFEWLDYAENHQLYGRAWPAHPSRYRDCRIR